MTALAYARHGIPVLPVHTPDRGGACSCARGSRCGRPGKHPRLRHGLSEASTDPHQIRLWWGFWPQANVGLRTGVIMDVADVDSPEGWHRLHRLLGEIPAGPQVRTGSGGRHLWFRPTGHGNRVRLLPGVDWRGSGGYVLAPPSRHASGGDYRWIRRPAVILPHGPAALVELIAGPPAAPVSRRTLAHPDRYAGAALHAEAGRVADAVVGMRNDTLNRAAFALGRLVGAGLLDESLVWWELSAAARHAGLGWTEIRGTIRSGLSAGRGQPFDSSPHAA